MKIAGTTIEPALYAAKLGGMVILLQGLTMSLAPKPTIMRYRSKSTDEKDPILHPRGIKAARRLGIALLGNGLATLGTIVMEYNVNAVLGFSQIPWILDCTYSLLNDESETVGPSKSGDLSVLAITVPSLLAGINNWGSASACFKTGALYGLSVGLLSMFVPSAITKGYKMKGEDDEATPGRIGRFGSAMVSSNVMLFALASGVDPIMAFGYSSLTGFLGGLKVFFFCNEYDKKNMRFNARAFWTVFPLVIAGATFPLVQ